MYAFDNVRKLALLAGINIEINVSFSVVKSKNVSNVSLGCSFAHVKGRFLCVARN